jgi:hypothetical protein
MKKVTLYKYISLLALLSGHFVAMSQDYRVSKEEARSFKIEDGAELMISNKYGRIQLIPWSEDSIKIAVKIEVRAKKEAKANEFLNSIAIDFVSYPSYVESKTSFTNQDSFWGGVKDKTNSMFSGDSKTQIDYTVYVPNNVNLNLENKYGDIYMEDHSGPVTISLSNGSLKGQNLSGSLSIKLEFGYANIKKVANAIIKMDHKSELILDEANYIKLDSRSSRVSINKVNSIVMNSYRDKYRIEQVGDIKADNSYTYLQLSQLDDVITVYAKYGNIDIGRIGDNVKQINLTVENTDIEIIKPTHRSITVDAIYSEKAGLYFPVEMINKKTNMEDEEKKLVKTTGMIGTSLVSPIKLNISIPTGNLRIK